MSRSTRLLYRLIRWRLGLGMAAAFLWFFLSPAVGGPLDSRYLVLIPWAGFGLALLMRLRSLLDGTLFPVTSRQLAWIPLSAWGLVILSGTAGLLLGQGIAVATMSFWLDDFFRYWAVAPRLWVSTIFLLLLFWRALQVGPAFIGLIGFAPAIFLSPGKGGLFPPEVSGRFLALWPLWALGCLFLVWEAPRQLAALRRLDFVEAGPDFLRTRTPELSGRSRPSRATALTDAVMSLLAFGMLAVTIPRTLAATAHNGPRNPLNLFFLFFLFIPVLLMVGIWRRNRASGMSPARAFGVLLIELTGVGYAFRDRFGVEHGMVARCPFCGGWRFAWQEACPHCGDQGPAAVSAAVSPERQPGLFPRHDPAAMFFRVLGPLYMLGIIVVMNWGRWFGG